MAEAFVPSPSVDSYTMPMDVKVPLMRDRINSDTSAHAIALQSMRDRATSSPIREDVAINRAQLPSRPSLRTKSISKPRKQFVMVSQVKTVSFYQALLSEFIGTMLLTFVCTSVGLPIGSPSVPDINGALAAGFIVATMIVCFGHTSGAHINPAVTLSFLVVGEIDIIRAICYIVMQLLGAASASLMLELLAPERAHAFLGMTMVGQDIPVSHALIVEIIITYILCHTVHAICDKKREDIGGSKALAVGLAVAIGCLIGGPYTGASMNPARSFGPAVVMNNWTNHWIYWVGPLIGGMIAAAIYSRALKQREPLVPLSTAQSLASLERNTTA